MHVHSVLQQDLSPNKPKRGLELFDKVKLLQGKKVTDDKWHEGYIQLHIDQVPSKPYGVVRPVEGRKPSGSVNRT